MIPGPTGGYCCCCCGGPKGGGARPLIGTACVAQGARGWADGGATGLRDAPPFFASQVPMSMLCLVCNIGGGSRPPAFFFSCGVGFAGVLATDAHVNFLAGPDWNIVVRTSKNPTKLTQVGGGARVDWLSSTINFVVDLPKSNCKFLQLWVTKPLLFLAHLQKKK